MCKNCFYTEIDGVPVHINGDPKDPEVMDAINSLVKVAKNYMMMKKLKEEADERRERD